MISLMPISVDKAVSENHIKKTQQELSEGGFVGLLGFACDGRVFTDFTPCNCIVVFVCCACDAVNDTSLYCEFKSLCCELIYDELSLSSLPFSIGVALTS